MKLKLPVQSSAWTRRGVHLIEVAFLLFWLGLALQSTHLVVASAIIFSYLALALTIQSGVPSSITLKRRLSERLTEDERTTTETLITNSSTTPCLVAVQESYPEGLDLVEGSTNYIAFIPPNAQNAISNVLSADFRGHYVIEPPVSVVMDELNLRGRKIDDATKSSYLTVFPPVEDLSDFPIGSRSSQPEIGAYRSGSVGVGTEFFGIRDYSPGDDLRRINWKASARSEFLLSNEYEREHVVNIYLIADLTSTLRGDLRWVVRTSASIATYLLKTRNRLGLIVLGEGISHVRIESGHRQLLRVLDKLVIAEPGGTGEVNPYLRRLLDNMPRCEIFLVSPLKSESIADTIIEVRHKQAQVSLITFRKPRSENFETDLIVHTAERLYELRRAAVIHRLEGSDVKVIEVQPETQVRSMISLAEERPIRR